MAEDSASSKVEEADSSDSNLRAKVQKQDEKIANLTQQISGLTLQLSKQDANSSYSSENQSHFHSVRLDSLSSQMNEMMKTVQSLQEVFVAAASKRKGGQSDEMMEVRLSSMSAQMGSLTKDMKSMQFTLESVQLRMNREEKKEQDQDLRKEIEEIKKTLEGLSAPKSENKGSSEREAMVKWMQCTVKLPEYVGVFIENGIENLNVVRLLTETELKQIGISKIGHRMQIRSEISKLNGNDNRYGYGSAPSLSRIVKAQEGNNTPYM